MKQDVGFYLHQEGPNLGKTSCPLSPVTIRLDAQFGTPYPRSAGFDTDNGDERAGSISAALAVWQGGVEVLLPGSSGGAFRQWPA
mgnify:CR=1 FL=1